MNSPILHEDKSCVNERKYMKAKSLLVIVMLASALICFSEKLVYTKDSGSESIDAVSRAEQLPDICISDVNDDNDERIEALPHSGGLTALNLALTPDNGADMLDSFDCTVGIVLLDRGEYISLTLRDYLIGVVAAEMPASFYAEALKAQAVAARSCTLHRMLHPDSTHPDADICTYSSCCQAYADTQKLLLKWGADYDMYYEKICQAVDATDGQYLAYGGVLIYAPYHSSSCGATESSGQIWSDTPYLISVSSPESAEDVPNFVSSVSFDESEFIGRLAEHHHEIANSSPLAIDNLVLSPSGRVDSLCVNGVRISGTQLRSALSLRSTSMDILHEDGVVTIVCYGWGHGVGMSQYGANVLAKDGFSYNDILMWYYTGVEILDMPKETESE